MPYGWLHVANFVLFGRALGAFAIGLQFRVVAGKWAKELFWAVAVVALAIEVDPVQREAPAARQVVRRGLDLNVAGP